MKTKRRINKKRRNTRKRKFLNKYKGGGNITYAEILEIFHKFLDDGILGKEGNNISHVFLLQKFAVLNDLFNKDLNNLCNSWKIDVISIDKLFNDTFTIPAIYRYNKNKLKQKIKEHRISIREKSLELLKEIGRIYHPDLLNKLKILDDTTDYFLIYKNDSSSGDEKYITNIHIDEFILEIYENIKKNVLIPINSMIEKFEFSDTSILSWVTFSGTRGVVDLAVYVRPLVDAFIYIIKTGIAFENVENFKNTETIFKCETNLNYIMKQLMGENLIRKMNIEYKTNRTPPLYVEKTIFIPKSKEGTERIIFITEEEKGKFFEPYSAEAQRLLYEDRVIREAQKDKIRVENKKTLFKTKVSEKRPTKPRKKILEVGEVGEVGEDVEYEE